MRNSICVEKNPPNQFICSTCGQKFDRPNKLQNHDCIIKKFKQVPNEVNYIMIPMESNCYKWAKTLKPADLYQFCYHSRSTLFLIDMFFFCNFKKVFFALKVCTALAISTIKFPERTSIFTIT